MTGVLATSCMSLGSTPSTSANTNAWSCLIFTRPERYSDKVRGWTPDCPETHDAVTCCSAMIRPSGCEVENLRPFAMTETIPYSHWWCPQTRSGPVRTPTNEGIRTGPPKGSTTHDWHCSPTTRAGRVESSYRPRFNADPNNPALPPAGTGITYGAKDSSPLAWSSRIWRT